MRTLFCVCSLLLVISCAGKEDDLTNSEAGRVDQIGGQLDIRIHPAEGRQTPPAELILVDPRGRKTGNDPRIDQMFRDISGSSYETEGIDDDVTSAPGPETHIVYVGNAMSGEYTLRVVGIESAPYDLELRGVDRELNPSTVRFLDIDIEADSDHRYVIEYSSELGSKIKARRD
jgi:hypothetical protein